MLNRLTHDLVRMQRFPILTDIHQKEEEEDRKLEARVQRQRARVPEDLHARAAQNHNDAAILIFP